MKLESAFKSVVSSVALSTLASIAACSGAPPGEPTGESVAAVTDERLDVLQVESAALEAGISCKAIDPATGNHSLVVAAAVAEAESGLCTWAIGAGGMGLWQIQYTNGGSPLGACSPNPDNMEVQCWNSPQTVSCTGGDWTNPSVNAGWMASMSSRGTNWQPWCTYGNCCNTCCPVNGVCSPPPYLNYIAAAKTAYASLCSCASFTKIGTYALLASLNVTLWKGCGVYHLTASGPNGDVISLKNGLGSVSATLSSDAASTANVVANPANNEVDVCATGVDYRNQIVTNCTGWFVP